jgi:hypothetical protein
MKNESLYAPVVWSARLGGAPVALMATLDGRGSPTRVTAEYGAIGNAKEGVLRCYCIAISKLLAKFAEARATRDEMLVEFDALLHRVDEDAGETGDPLVPWSGCLGSYVVASLWAHVDKALAERGAHVVEAAGMAGGCSGE